MGWSTRFWWFEYWGIRAAFTHTNRSHNLGFAGVSLNTEYNWVTRSLYAGVHLGSQNTFTDEGRKQSKMEIVPEIGYEFSLIFLGLGASLNTHALQPRIGLSFSIFIRLMWGIPFLSAEIQSLKDWPSRLCLISLMQKVVMILGCGNSRIS